MSRRDWNISPNQKGYKRLGDAIPVIQVTNGANAECKHCAGTGYEVIVTYKGKGMHGVIREITDLAPCRCRASGACTACSGRGYVLSDSTPRDCPLNCLASQKLKAKRESGVIKYSQLPPEYQPLTFVTFDRMSIEYQNGKYPARVAAEQFVEAIDQGGYVNRAAVAALFGRTADDDWRNWLVFYGEHGRGKTGLAAAIVNALATNGKACLYIRLGDFIEAVQKRYSKDRRDGFDDEFGATAEDVLDEVKRAPILVCDEFDVSDVTTNKRSIVEKLVRYRHGQNLPTVITTNLDADSFERRWERTISTVVRDRAHWLPMRGLSLRRDVNEFEWE